MVRSAGLGPAPLRVIVRLRAGNRRRKAILARKPPNRASVPAPRSNNARVQQSRSGPIRPNPRAARPPCDPCRAGCRRHRVRVTPAHAIGNSQGAFGLLEYSQYLLTNTL